MKEERLLFGQGLDDYFIILDKWKTASSHQPTASQYEFNHLLPIRWTLDTNIKRLEKQIIALSNHANIPSLYNPSFL